jgi:hypothetical protein
VCVGECVQCCNLSLPVFRLCAAPFELYFLCLVGTGVLQGLTNPIFTAFRADCIPLDESGKPASAARDASVLMYSAFIPMVFLPALTGSLFSAFAATTASRVVAYKWLYAWALLTCGCGIALFTRIPPNGCHDEATLLLKQKREEEEDIRGGRSHHRRRAAPLGARLCDRCLFGPQDK